MVIEGETAFPARPQSAGTIGLKKRDGPRQSGEIGKFFRAQKTDSVETEQSLIGTHPNIPVWRLRHRQRRTFREAVMILPRFNQKVCIRVPGLSAAGQRCQRGQTHRQPDNSEIFQSS